VLQKRQGIDAHAMCVFDTCGRKEGHLTWSVRLPSEVLQAPLIVLAIDFALGVSPL
jgi:hypothetical protein